MSKDSNFSIHQHNFQPKEQIFQTDPTSKREKQAPQKEKEKQQSIREQKLSTTAINQRTKDQCNQQTQETTRTASTQQPDSSLPTESKRVAEVSDQEEEAGNEKKLGFLRFQAEEKSAFFLFLRLTLLNASYTTHAGKNLSTSRTLLPNQSLIYLPNLPHTTSVPLSLSLRRLKGKSSTT